MPAYAFGMPFKSVKYTTALKSYITQKVRNGLNFVYVTVK
jgi:FMN-dependent NADH-azoreductase